ncbi:DUF3987 domain-containing protein [Geothrix edaphica]|uniref:Toprim domain-containing protein n=1 Tax=Geothrix edaphica TaxID=2927976 RepID=A0ABQ5PYT2_9BACT|nr:DUF3987 domain-containing protein [Geothrix edaphica]GLH67311.1 hypothetical protein GETHED_16750 [Geothrix edaphica]
MLDAVDQFKEALHARGLVPPVEIQADGEIHRCHAEGRGGENDGAYLLHLDGIPAGGFENWRDGEGWENWRADIGRTLTPEEEAAHRSHTEAMRKAREAEDKRRKAEARERAKRVWDSALPCTGHPYLTRKGIKAHGARIVSNGYRKGDLVLPVRDAEGKLHSLQFIGQDGGKLFLPGGRKRACYFSIGKPAGVLYVAEGFATAASIHEATGQAVAVAFDAGNLQPVAESLRAKYPGLDLVIAADDDYRTDGNPGRAKATEAARAIGAKIALPVFGEDRPERATDYNDLHQSRGLEAVRVCLEGAGLVPSPAKEAGKNEAARAANAGENPQGWPEAQPFTSRVEALPYPVDALPEVIRAAVEEVQGFVQAPVPLVASSALAALSLAAQAHWDMRRAEKLAGPVGLFLLTIADSGERKSTCDGFFTRVIRDYEAQQAELAKPAVKDYRAALDAWEAQRNGIKDGIRAGAKAGKDTQALERKLRDLEHEKPEGPRVPRLIYADATPESLKWSLAKVWPSGGVVSSEAGIVFGSHGMGNESAMRNLGTLNQLWDGTEIATERRTSESFTVRGARLSIALQVQEATLRAFFDQSGTLARGSGFMARFLVAWPESTQGSRPFTEAPATWPYLSAFNRRIEALLNLPAPIDGDGALAPAMLSFSVEAKAEWVAFHDRIERDLPNGERFHDIRDVASKIADNAARMAALFHAFEGAAGGAVGVDSFRSAARIAEWHLNEARRFFGELALPAGLADAAHLESWLVNRCRKNGSSEVPTKEVQQFGPGTLREKAKIDAAMMELEELGRARRITEGKRRFITLNPSILAPVEPATAIPATFAIPSTLNPQNEAIGSRNSRNSSSKPAMPEDRAPFKAVSGEAFTVDL